MTEQAERLAPGGRRTSLPQSVRERAEAAARDAVRGSMMRLTWDNIYHVALVAARKDLGLPSDTTVVGNVERYNAAHVIARRAAARWTER